MTWFPANPETGRSAMTEPAIRAVPREASDMTAGEEDLDALRRQWPAWSIWVSRRGELVCATRRRRLTAAEALSGLAPTLVESDPAALTAKLHEEQAKEPTLP